MPEEYLIDYIPKTKQTNVDHTCQKQHVDMYQNIEEEVPNDERNKACLT